MQTKITIVFHKDSHELLTYAQKLFKLLYRDMNDPVKKGLMIDTYFIQVDERIDMTPYAEGYSIFLVDDALVVSEITGVNDANSLIISYTDNIHKSDLDTSRLFLDARHEDEQSIERGIWSFLAEKFYARKKLTLFLSHTKRDGIGEEEAKKYHAFIAQDTKLKSFIDLNDISYANDFQETIDEHLNDSIFIGFESDAYSGSKWTQYELLQAKKNALPIIIINCIQQKVDRRFPYLGNCLVLENHSIENNINTILIEAIRLKQGQQKMQTYAALYNDPNVQFVNTVPELLDVHTATKERLIYPDPPITDIEEQLLLRGGKKIYTPLTYQCQNHLSKQVGISISEVNGGFDNGFENIHLYTAEEEIAKYLLYTKNTIIYGGDIQYKEPFNFIKILAHIAETYGIKNAIINHVCYPLNRAIDTKIKSDYKGIVDFKTFNELDVECAEGAMPYNDLSCGIDFAKNLSLMRMMMAGACDARVMLGGKHFGYLGRYPGLLEEAYYTLKAGKPLFLIGGFGGVSKLMIDLINGKEVEELTYVWQYAHTENGSFRNLVDNGVAVDYGEVMGTIKTARLNGLSNEENEKLFYSTSIEEIVFYLLRGLSL
jgi:hypothetical protein